MAQTQRVPIGRVVKCICTAPVYAVGVDGKSIMIKCGRQGCDTWHRIDVFAGAVNVPSIPDFSPLAGGAEGPRGRAAAPRREPVDDGSSIIDVEPEPRR